GANEDGFHLKNVNPVRDFKVHFNGDVSLAQNGDACPSCGGKLKSVRGSEVGHIFYLGKKYSEAMNVNFLDRDGKSKIVEMGCYGIGVTRTIQAAIEQAHDADGMIWPAAIAPFVVHVCLLDQDEKILSVLKEITTSLDKVGVDYFIDDREERPGVKFKDADLLGSPLRITLGKKGVEAGQIELTDRKSKQTEKISLSEATSKITSRAQQLLKVQL
ncbi:proline--tRNA ligase, partial [bacterium]|nr:proline--tRNA ligase [bacterium]